MGYISVIAFTWLILMINSKELVSTNITHSKEDPDCYKAVIKGFTEGQPYRVIEGRQGQLTCMIKGGSRLPTLTWTCFNVGTFDHTENNTIVSKTARWTAVRGPDMKCTCYYSHPNCSGFKSIQVQTLYPPSKPVFYIKNKEVSGTVKVIRHHRVSLMCSSSGKPGLAYSWTWYAVPVSGPIITIGRVEKNDRLICNVKNFMDQSDGETVVGTNSSSINIEMLYPAVVGSLRNRSIAEGDTLNVSCPVTTGNPPETYFKWTNNAKEWKTQILEIVNVSRKDAMMYTCEAGNIMKETGRVLQIYHPDRTTFFLNVLYGATVTDFYAEGFEDKTSVTVNETDKVHLYCNVDSNPGSNIFIKNHKDSVNISSGSGVKSLNVSLESASCLDAGIFKCSSYNGYYSPVPMKQLTLFVNCSPRISPNFDIKTVKRSTENHSVVFTFKTLAYPEPPVDDFQWFGWYGGQWVSLRNNEAFKIDTRNLESNLTVNYVNKTSYGLYKVIVRNPLGQFEQIFLLLPTEGQTQSICSNSDVTSTSVIIGTVLGLIIAILVLYAGYLTYLFRWKGRCYDQTLPHNFIEDKTIVASYTNTLFSTDAAVHQEIPIVPEYTSLDKNQKSECVSYETLQAT